MGSTTGIKDVPPCAAFVASADPKRAFRVSTQVFPVVTDPEFVPLRDAGFMRADDWVLGVRIGDTARCYPAFMLDNSHAVNDTIEGSEIAVIHCEICCSNAVFDARHDGSRLTFGTGGLYGGTLAVYDEQTGSLWSHGMGAAFDGPLRGLALERLPSVQASFAEWSALHPDSEVMVWRAPACHPDARHGHGADATFALAGMEELVLRTMTAGADDRLPEAEMIVTIFAPDAQAVLPLVELFRAGGLFVSDVGGTRIATISHGPGSALTGSFATHLEGEPAAVVDLILRDGHVIDRRSGSTFRADGRAIDGPLNRRRLEPVPTMTSKWHSLTCYLPGVPILKHEGAPAPIDEGELVEALRVLRSAGHDVRVRTELYGLEIPHGAQHGLRIEIDGDSFHAFAFADAGNAADEALGRERALCEGGLLLVSAPARFADYWNSVPLPPEKIAWSPLLRDDRFREAAGRAAEAMPSVARAPRPWLADLVDGLRRQGIEVTAIRSCERDTLPPGALFGVYARIAGDPFLLYRFDSVSAAREHSPDPAHSIMIGHLVLRSDPADLYRDLDRRTLRRPDESVAWSRLLTSDSFARSLHALDAKAASA